MAVLVIPPPLRPFVAGREAVDVVGGTVVEALRDADRQFPGLYERVCPAGKLAPGLAVAVDGEIQPMGLKAAIGRESEIHIVPAIGGGSGSKPARGAHADGAVETS